ncbi:hypothetical protein KSF_096750 [Reticulibacter mediterranei]|uniref:AAA+ ATPase domain-containing protein n=1 Tax=Reticulibacter mediterranei TaxID=2778369 RepID=A0A8J3IZH9_9CHLR|nr:AAA family ATPase [Reticulibacter mediterranei]GHO99627.1 hypothetical protein KSF_096750 [Reticulibacter mediterranei]
MVVTLDEIVEAYLADKDFQADRLELARRRDESLPMLQETVQQFIRGRSNLETFRSLLDMELRTGEDWGATGMGFMVQLNNLNKYHNGPDSNVDLRFRIILQGLNAITVGQCIEVFYEFLLAEQDRLRRAGKSSGMIVAPSRSPFIISLLAFWLDPTPRSIIYYTSLRKGLHRLMATGAVSTPPDLALSTTNVEIRTTTHHEAVNEIVDYLIRHVPELQDGTNYWFESFCYWVGEHWQSSALPENTLVAEKDGTNLLTQTLTGTTVASEDEETLDPPPSTAEKTEAEARMSKLLIPHEPLLPTPEPLLIQLIQEVQRHILVDEQLVRRIYHALLAGHVILTGPPGTGKTELARLIPEILWQSKTDDGEQDDDPALSRETAYTTRMVTATDDWSPRTLISSIVPQTINGTVSYKVQYGHLTATILKNWSFDGNQPEEWSTLTLHRTRITTPAGTERGTLQTFKGQWLVIDEFNRAPIDLALGDALTALGGNDVLRVPIDNGSAELPIPQDFRIIGTLNSFDRHYLNQISEALKRRFSFVEILPPTRAQRSAEQGIVLYKALKKVSHLSQAISVDADALSWDGTVAIEADASGQYELLWEDENAPFPAAFRAAWHIFEIIRIYRPLGTAQAIGLIRHMLIAGILQDYKTYEAWCGALDAALCDTIVDQLQVLLPDEIETLFLYLTTPPESFADTYHQQLNELASAPQRLYGQLRAFSTIVDDNGILYLSDADIERIVALDQPTMTNATLQQLFHLDHEHPTLPQFIRRLRVFKAERGL